MTTYILYSDKYEKTNIQNRYNDEICGAFYCPTKELNDTRRHTVTTEVIKVRECLLYEKGFDYDIFNFVNILANINKYSFMVHHFYFTVLVPQTVHHKVFSLSHVRCTRFVASI